MQKKWWFLFTCLDLSFRYCYIRPTLKNGRLQRCEASMLRSWNDASKFIDFCIACRSRLPKRRLLIQLTSYWNANEGDFSKKSRLPPLTISQTTQQTPDTAPPPGNASWERQQMQPERTKRCRKDAIWDSSRVGGILRPISSKRNWFCWCLFSVGWKWLKKISNQVLWFLWKGSETLKILCSCGHLGKNASWGNQACNLAAACEWKWTGYKDLHKETFRRTGKAYRHLQTFKDLGRERESAMSNQMQSISITNRKLTRGQKEIKKALAQKSAFRCFTNTWPDMISVKSRQYA